MTGINGTDDGSGGAIAIHQAEHCRFAYTLNNMQPVRCSIIGDQPLFFMDFEGELDDDCLDDNGSDPFGIGAIEQGVADLKKRILGLDDQGFSEQAQIRLADFTDTGAAMATQGEMAHDQGFRLKTLEKILCASRLSGALLDAAKSYDIHLGFNRQVEHAFYDRAAKTVFLNPGRDDNDLALLAIRELRRVWQHKNGALLHPLTFHPDQAILINRAQHADLAVTMVRGAWELQLAGHKAVWERLEGAEAEDLTRAFAREAFLDFRTVNNGQASSAVFEAWFLSERCRHEDRALIQGMLSDYQGYMFDSEQASKSVGADLVLALGSMPFGNNYLAPFVTTVVSDPLFAEVRDRSNANFLWFIKFEHSFREAERDLQTSSPIQDRDHKRGSSITKKLDGDDAQKSKILAHPGQGRSLAPKKLPAAARACPDANAADDAEAGRNVVYLSAYAKR